MKSDKFQERMKCKFKNKKQTCKKKLNKTKKQKTGNLTEVDIDWILTIVTYMYAYKQTPKFFEALIKRFFLIINKLKLYIMQYDLWVVQKKKRRLDSSFQRMRTFYKII